MAPNNGDTKRKATDVPPLTSRQLEMQKNALPGAVHQTAVPAPALKRVRIDRVIATKKPRQPPPTAPETTASPAKQAKTVRLHSHRISDEDLFIILCRDNLVPGAAGPKDWHVVATEFNARFRADGSKKVLAYNTVSRRCGEARKTFVRDNPGYVKTVVYPVPEEDEEGDEEEGETGELDGEWEGDEEEGDRLAERISSRLSKEVPRHLLDPRLTSGPAATLATPLPSSPVHKDDSDDRRVPNVSQQSAVPKLRNFANNPPPTSIPGSFNPSSIPDHHIFVIDRMKFHLRRRTSSPVTFLFPSAHEASFVKEDPQYIDTSTLLALSPFYARQIWQDPEDTSITVPAHISTRTLNIFLQLVTPVPATFLPTHYLWKSRTPEPGVYDRFGAVEAEKIVWTVDTLLDLLLFARYMEVEWVSDIVIDRLYAIFSEQKRVRSVFQGVRNGYLRLDDRKTKRKVFVESQLPSMENAMGGLAAEDFGNEDLGRLVSGSVDAPTLKFVASVLRALVGEANPLWVSSAAKEVRDIFAHADASHLDASSREDFCARYHHHGSYACYTSHTTYPAIHFINALYTTSDPQELITLSDGLLPATSLASILYSSSGDASKLKKDNSSAEMVHAEKMVLEMESRLELRRGALLRGCTCLLRLEGEDKRCPCCESRVSDLDERHCPRVSNLIMMVVTS
jgi:hypothetical protein